MRTVEGYGVDTSPLLVTAEVDNGKVVRVEVSFATPLSGTLNVHYDPYMLESSLMIKEDTTSNGFWFHQDTRRKMQEAFNNTNIGPDVAYASFLEILSQNNIAATSDASVAMRLELLEGQEITQVPTWRLSYMEPKEGKHFRALIDARTGEVINISP